MGAWDWLTGVGEGAYNWAGSNPLQALSLGVGAAGTGMGLWDAYQANKQAEDRRKLAEQFSRMGPTAFNPNWSSEQLQAMYFRPAATFQASQGITDGGAFRQALADAALKAEADRNQIGNQIFQSRLGALGYGQPRQASGSVGGFGQALNNIMLQQALARGGGYGGYRGGQPSTPGATMGGDAGRDWQTNQNANQQWLTDNPAYSGGGFRPGQSGQVGNWQTGQSLQGQPGQDYLYPQEAISGGQSAQGFGQPSGWGGAYPPQLNYPAYPGEGGDYF